MQQCRKETGVFPTRIAVEKEVTGFGERLWRRAVVGKPQPRGLNLALAYFHMALIVKNDFYHVEWLKKKEKTIFINGYLKNVTETTCGLQSLQYLLSVSYRKGLTNLGIESANHELKSGGGRNEGQMGMKESAPAFKLSKQVMNTPSPLQPISPLAASILSFTCFCCWTSFTVIFIYLYVCLPSLAVTYLSNSIFSQYLPHPALYKTHAP